MPFTLVSTLPRLRAVYAVPRGPARFQAYIDAVVGGAQATADVAVPPLVAANPMARGDAAAVLDAWLALDAEGVAADVLREAAAELDAPPTPVRVGLTLLDDEGGGWTDRLVNDAARFRAGHTLAQTGWVSVPLWTSEPPSLAALRGSVREAAWRAVHVARTGDPRTLRAMLSQEGRAAAFAGRLPTLDADDLAYTRAVIAPHLGSDHQPLTLAAFYGDPGARAWGYAPLGLSPWAGRDVGLDDARRAEEWR
ncbi:MULTISPECIES: hypothetical protein [Deinococcus]|uniref:Uncharacterized protein n=1 Tax=Deinococcus rufus TaxID=2136097 RepID=A0ABV7ZEF0_9DEIO|nr:hypothetical protein [Deinococcus sp. AB2017081]WQE94147.1 hypothetical protein U2P90_12080 [Deinococcus sp. AB2017081]